MATIDSRIVSALEGLAPVWNAVKEEAEGETTETYFAFNYSTFGTGYADDDPTGEIALVQVHVFAPLNVNVTRLVRQAKTAIHEAGFTWPERIDASDANSRHIVLEFQDVEGVDFDGEL